MAYADAAHAMPSAAASATHAPTIFNTAYQPLHFWDGRAVSLEHQSQGPVMNPTTQPPAEPPAGPTDREQSSAGPDARADKAARSRVPAPKAVPAGDLEQRLEAKQTDSAMWGIVGHMAASLVVYGGLGYLLGRWTGHPILLLFGVLFGLVLSIAYTIYTANKNNPQ